MRTLKDICDEAKVVGTQIDITGCHYGLHSRTKRNIGETEYYRFLAGFARVTQAMRILEIGTHYGGSIKALARGADSKASLVTVDLKLHNQEGFSGCTNIHRVRGDSLAPATIVEVSKWMAGPIDLMYIDSLHTYDAVMANISEYAHLNPEFIVLDDIHINETMDKAWEELGSRYETCDVSDIADRRRVGFGVVRMRDRG